MAEILTPDLCVLGGGAGGIVAAFATATAGANVVVVENRRFAEGYSEAALITHALIEAARVASHRQADHLFGASAVDVTPNMPALRARIEQLKSGVVLDTPARLAALNVTMIEGTGRFTSHTRLEAAARTIEAKWFLVATGAQPPLAPPIKGFELVRPLTLEDLLLLDTWPKQLALLGGGAHGLALAQAFRRLGSEVHLFDSGQFLPGEDRELVAPVLARLRREGVVLHEETSVARVEPRGDGLFIETASRGAAQRIEATHLVMTEQPVPRVEGLGLKEAGVRYDARGIKVRTDLRTSNPRIYAIGDALGGVQSHARARYQAQQVVAQIFDASPRPVAPAPRVVFTEPELAVIGVTEEAVQASGRDMRILRAAFHDNIAAQSAGEGEGHVKLITDGRDQLLGAGIVGPRARELIGLYGFAISLDLHAGDLKGFVPASPSLTEVGRFAVLASPAQFGKRLWRRVFPISRRRK